MCIRDRSKVPLFSFSERSYILSMKLDVLATFALSPVILKEFPLFEISTSKNISICRIFLSSKPHKLASLSLSMGSNFIC